MGVGSEVGTGVDNSSEVFSLAVGVGCDTVKGSTMGAAVQAESSKAKPMVITKSITEKTFEYIG